MFSWTSLTKFQPPLRRLAAIQRLHSTSSSSSSSSSSLGGVRYGENRGKGSDFGSFLRSISSGVVVVGSTLGFWYCSSLSSSLGGNSLQSFADYATEEDQFQQEKKSIFLFNDSYRRRVFFKYEKRIRLQSPPEKVFEYFASVRTPSQEVFMTPADLMRAVVPVFPPSGSNRVREGSLRGEQNPSELHCAPSNFFMLFDTNSDGLISFPEKIDKEEFNKVMRLMRQQNRQGSQQRDGDGASVENGGLLEYFFGKDGTNCLQLETFAQFLRDLHDEILRLEFSHYDYNQRGSISARDFALSLVASADINHINKLLDIVDELESDSHLRSIRITFQEFKHFAELRKKLQSFSLALFSYGKINGVLTKTDFQRAASQVCGVTITDNVVDIIFHVFDENHDGNLSANEFIRVVQKRENNSSRVGCRSMISCWLNCASNCSSGKLQF